MYIHTKFFLINNYNIFHNNNDSETSNLSISLTDTINIDKMHSYEVSYETQLLILENTDIENFQEKIIKQDLKIMIIFSPLCRTTGPFPRDPH